MAAKKSATIPLITGEKSTGNPSWAPLALGFRPFFLLGIWFAVLLIAIALYGFTYGWPDSYFDLPTWHGHEMLFGYTTAIIAGFLLTATRNWTGLPTPTGTALALLTMLWLIPRLLAPTSILPAPLFTLLDMLFLPALAVILGRLILQARQPQNYPIPLLILLLALCNLAVHMEILGIIDNISTQAIQAAVCIIIALIAVVGGRVVPFFIQSSTGTRPAPIAVVEKFASPSILLLAMSIIIANHNLIIATSGFAAIVHGARCIRWFQPTLWRQPMLWGLYAGYVWMVVGFLLYGLEVWTGQGVTHALHAWTLGTIGMFTTGMITRVALGHTGRAIQAMPWIPAAFLLIFLAAILRALLPIASPALLDMAVRASAICWMAAFVIIGIRYSSILLRARRDGKPG